MEIATLVPSWPAALIGYALVGAGCSNVVPVLCTAASSQADMPEGITVPAITTLGFAGIPGGPAAIGAEARATSLSVALMALAIILLADVARAGRRIRS